MGSMQRRMVVLGGLLGIVSCTADASSESGTPGAGARDPATVAASPPLPGFGADVPAGQLPGSAPLASGPDSAVAPAVATPGSTTPGAADSARQPVGGGGGSPAGATADSTSASALTLAAGEISAATGVFTAAQAERGREVYDNSCANCHMVSAHSGGTFASMWHSRRVSDLYTFLFNAMPLDAPGSLTDQQYADVVAYMLQLNGHPAGKSALKPDTVAMRKLRIDIRSVTSR